MSKIKISKCQTNPFVRFKFTCAYSLWRWWCWRDFFFRLSSGGAVIGRLAMAGSIVKGPVANALIFQDIDGDGYTEGVDPFTFTDVDGNYDMRFFPGSGQIVVLDEYYVDSANRPVSMNILGEPTGEQFQSNPDRFTLKKAIDLTTGSQPGSFTFDTPEGEISGFVTTPVSTVDGEMTAGADHTPIQPNSEIFLLQQFKGG